MCISSPYRAANTPRYGYKNVSQSVLHSEVVAVSSQIRTKNTNTLCGQNVGG